MPALNIPAYMSLWYQMYGNAFVFATTSGESPTCATALYTLKSDATIAVHNYELLKGVVTTIDGYAYQPDASKPGQLKLHIDSVPVDGPYYILSLGPINAGGLYDWAVVSDPFGLSLFILARDPGEWGIIYIKKSYGFGIIYVSWVLLLYRSQYCYSISHNVPYPYHYPYP